MTTCSKRKAIGMCLAGIVFTYELALQPALAQDSDYFDTEGRVVVNPEDAAPAEDGFQPVWVQQLRELREKAAAAKTQQLSPTDVTPPTTGSSPQPVRKRARP